MDNVLLRLDTLVQWPPKGSTSDLIVLGVKPSEHEVLKDTLIQIITASKIVS